ncbi:unnamed protein product [Schistosoma bovis]|nr:unnamed protein product [Schistosoma bovis]
MMRFNSPYDLFIRISMILNVFSGFCICDEICKHPNWVNFEQVIFKNESYRYSHHYHYSQTINLNQPRPNVNGSFIEYKKIQPIKPEFPLKYFESEVSKFEIWPSGVLYMFKKDEKIGQISNNLGRSLSRQLLDEMNIPIVTNLLYPNGKISIYYENNILEISKDTDYGIRGIFQCETGKKEHEISVPVEWMKNGTLVEYEVIGTICPIHNSSEACLNAITSNVTCIWCEKWNTCIDSNHQNHHFFKVNGCHFKNTTTEISKESRQNKSLWYLYIIIPLIVFIAACTGYVTWKCLHKKRRSSE